MHSLHADGLVLNLLQRPDLGGEDWWRQVAELGTPLVESLPAAQVRVTFFWRDPWGDERRSPIKKVYVDINCVTDHHSPSPQSLERRPGSDIWWWQFTVREDWRGSYSFIPIETAQLPPAFTGDAAQRRQQQRQWWCSLFPLMRHDPLNPVAPHCSSRGFPLSAIHLPAAPDQSAWRALDAGQALPAASGRLQHFFWHSERLANRRNIWLYATGAGEDRPLVVLLDGQFWLHGIPIFSALDAETLNGRLPSALYLFIDVIDMARRAEELACNAAFWRAVQEELLPQVAARTPYSDDPQRTVVAGQSYGGLAALYAGLHWPQRFGCVLTQSGFFWWPHIEAMINPAEEYDADVGWLTEQVRRGLCAATPLRVFQEAGEGERDIHQVNRQMHRALVEAGHRVDYRVFAGGHDAVCWRGGLLDGLRALLAP